MDQYEVYPNNELYEKIVDSSLINYKKEFIKNTYFGFENKWKDLYTD
jgi:hypothetical protein